MPKPTPRVSKFRDSAAAPVAPVNISPRISLARTHRLRRFHQCRSQQLLKTCDGQLLSENARRCFVHLPGQGGSCRMTGRCEVTVRKDIPALSGGLYCPHRVQPVDIEHHLQASEFDGSYTCRRSDSSLTTA